jgi:ATP-dependent exoDNAse (exonuclease V) alpha subunit
MALASHRITIISRAKGRSSVAAAAYRSGEKITDERTGITYNYTQKPGVVHSEILTPEGTPAWAKERAQLWNAVEQAEKSKNAQLAREVMIALPRELSKEQNIALARAYAQTFVNEGMIADV